VHLEEQYVLVYFTQYEYFTNYLSYLFIYYYLPEILRNHKETITCKQA